MKYQTSEYQQIFDARGHSYNEACRKCPHARETERSHLIDRLDIRSGQRICDAPAGGGYLAEGIERMGSNHKDIICIEPAKGFVEGINHKFSWIRSELANLALQTESIDRLGSLAGLHHITEKLDVFQEAYRVLVPGGRIAVADVLDGTAVALFLNDSVDRLTETGHKGTFFQQGELTFLLRASGFENVSEQHVHFTWDFPDRTMLVWYCRQLFGLVKSWPAGVEAELGRFFTIQEGDGSAHLPWSLTYAAATKPVRKVISDDRGKHGMHLRFGRHRETEWH